ncbi:MAG: hypothetical protein AAF789_00740 [Bacteroidota bacterium]
MILAFGKFYRLLQILSLDVAFGAIALLRFYSHRFDFEISWQLCFAQGAAIWIVYTLDHLKDANADLASRRVRFVFHQLYKKSIRITLLVVLAGLLVVILRLDTRLVVGGVVIAVVSLLFLLFQKQLAKYGIKELVVALTYSTGMLLIPFVQGNESAVLDFIFLFLISYCNLLLFSFFEHKEDLMDGFMSFSTQFGKRRTTNFIMILLSVAFSLYFALLVHPYYIICILIYCTFLVFTHFYKVQRCYRWVGDGVFLLPFLWDWL